MSLKRQAFSAFRWTTFSSVAVTLIQLVQMAILARILHPHAFGLMALATVVIGFSQAFTDMGISNALIHKQDISPVQSSTLYWLNVLAGVAVFAIVSLVSPLVAAFYHEKELTRIIFLIGFTFVVQPFGQQFRVLKQKELSFAVIAKIDVVTRLLGLGISTFLALWEFEVYSLVYSTLITAAFSSVCFMVAGWNKHRPSFHFKINEVKGFLGFGAYQMGEKSINYLSANIDKILIGKYIGMEAVGFYNLAWQLIILPLQKINPIVNQVAFPIYAKMQDDKKALARYFSLSLHLLSIITVPLLVFMAFFSNEIVLTFYGKGWEKAADLLTILSAVGIIKTLSNPGGSVILALGRADIGFWWNVAWALIVTIGLTTSLAMMPDLKVVAYTLLGLSVLFGWVWFYMVFKLSTINAKTALRPILQIVGVGIILALLVSTVLDVSFIFTASYRLIATGVAFCLLYALYLFLFERKIYYATR